MPDNLSGQQNNQNNSPATDSTQESVTQQTQSPLEASSSQDPPMEPPKETPPPAPTTPEGTPAQGAPPVTSSGSGQPANTPDTEEFLKSILGDAPNQGTEAPPPPEETPVAPAGGVSTPVETTSAEPEINSTIQEPTDVLQEPAIKDGTSDLDDILKENTELSAPAADVSSPESVSQERGTGKPISHDIVGTMSQTPTATKTPMKLIGLIILAVIIAVGGYFAYSTLIAPSSTKESSKSATISATPAAETTATYDQTRKSDLANLQNALKNYYAGTGSYPVTESLTLLTDEDNVLKQELVTAQKLLDKIPLDPAYPTRKYGYVSDGKTFTLSAALDDPTDPGVVVEGGLNLYKVTQDSIVSSTSS